MNIICSAVQQLILPTRCGNSLLGNRLRITCSIFIKVVTLTWADHVFFGGAHLRWNGTGFQDSKTLQCCCQVTWRPSSRNSSTTSTPAKAMVKCGGQWGRKMKAKVFMFSIAHCFGVVITYDISSIIFHDMALEYYSYHLWYLKYNIWWYGFGVVITYDISSIIFHDVVAISPLNSPWVYPPART